VGTTDAPEKFWHGSGKVIPWMNARKDLTGTALVQDNDHSPRGLV
jgi:hypothetical protein